MPLFSLKSPNFTACSKYSDNQLSVKVVIVNTTTSTIGDVMLLRSCEYAGNFATNQTNMGCQLLEKH